MNENVKVVFGLIGGLALFLYGMNSMSDALQKAAGEKMKKILEFLTPECSMILFLITIEHLHNCLHFSNFFKDFLNFLVFPIFITYNEYKERLANHPFF